MTDPPSRVEDYQTGNVIDMPDRFGSRRPPGPPLQPPAGDGTSTVMEGRISKLEGQFDVYKVIAAGLLTVMVFGFGLLMTLYARLDTKIDAVNEKVDALPGKINADLRDITRTLAESITAAKQTPPQVLLIPTPLPAPAPAPPNH